ncbi:MAG: T9SS type A sorting domain-containing protein [Ignavibacteriales bacterium]|nr:T9SS type A sorting domain-containing protein [Ignavibacteriales bacterium]
MKKRFLLVLLLSFAFYSTSNAQGKLTITSDSTSYCYGQPITLKIEILNDSDSTLSFYSCPGGVYKFDEFNVGNYIICAGDPPTTEINPGSSITWLWKVEPSKLGIPNKDGEHTVIGYYPFSTIADTIKISAPIYYGGIISVGFDIGMENEVSKIRDSLGAIIINSYGSSQIWQIQGHLIDSIISKYKNDSRFRYVEHSISVEPDSIFTSVEQNKSTFPVKDFELSEVFPNPFNSTANFYVTVNRTQNILIDIFNSIGQKVSTVYKGMIEANKRTSFTINLNVAASGVYLLSIRNSKISVGRKIFLLK